MLRIASTNFESGDAALACIVPTPVAIVAVAVHATAASTVHSRAAAVEVVLLVAAVIVAAAFPIVVVEILSAPVATAAVAATAAVYDWLENLNALYAAAMAETSRTNITLGPGERTRGRVMLEQFWNELKMLVTLDLTSMGVSRSTAGTLYTGGISESVKETYEEDSDRVSPKFIKGMFDFPGTIRPGADSAS